MTNHEKHILLWDELARTGSFDKEGVFERLFPEEKDGFDHAYCWACYDCDCCDDCPIEWVTEGRNHCVEIDSPYNYWDHSGLIEARKLLAAQIRDLPWRVK